MTGQRIKVKINSCYAFGLTEEVKERFSSGEGLSVEVDPGATIEEVLHKLPGIGPAEEWDALLLHVFVNGRAMGFDHVIQSDDVIDIHIPCSGG